MAGDILKNCRIRRIANRDEWESLYIHCGKQYLTQSWSFGEAKRIAQKWFPERFAFEYAGQTVAICMVLKKRVFGVTLVSRINRGPLFIGFSPSKEIYEAVLKRLRNEWKYLIHGVLLIAPALESKNWELEILNKSGFRRWTDYRWSSSLINLSPNESDIRKSLKEKWRYNLGLAERKGLAANVSSEKKAFEWIVEKHRENMCAKKFK
jgi:lipid II:glycine glycyltransferase (peptidoglycan interpeptide bridge formation enzyme)